MISLDEANAALVNLEPLVQALQERQISCQQEHDYYLMGELLAETETGEVLPERLPALQREAQVLDEAHHRFKTEVERIREFGGIVRNLDAGCIEFYSVLEGVPVFLIWKIGEKKINYYRRPQEPLSCRRPIVQL